MTFNYKKHYKKYLLVLVVILVVLFGVLRLFHAWPFHKAEPLVTSSSSFNTKGELHATNGTTAGTPTPSTGNASDKSTAAANTTLYVPSGSFVSNHHPNLSGSPAPSSMTSVCNTTPGAVCTVTFTSNGVSKSLPGQTIDPNGSTYWSWSLQSLGLTAGTWSIEATATLNNQTKTAADAMDLVVAQ